MFPLSINLLNSCHKTLLECPQFKSDQALRAIFVTQELAPFQTDLPEADNRNDRVARLIEYLRKKKTSDGDAAFLAFMNTLCIYISEGDELHGQLRALCTDIEIEYFCQSFVSAPIATAFSVNRSAGLSVYPETLIKHFLKFRYLREQHLRKEIINLLPHETVRGISYNGRTSEIRASLQLIQACSGSPDGLEKLAYALYQKEGPTPQWLELDSLLWRRSTTVVTYTRLQQLRLILSTITWPVQVLKYAYRVSTPPGRIFLLGISKHSELLPLMLEDIATLPVQSDETIPLLVFSLCLYAYAQQQEEKGLQTALHQWINERIEEAKLDEHQVKALQRRAEEMQLHSSHYLLIMLDPASKDLFWIRAWLLDSNNIVLPNVSTGCEDEPIALEKVPTILNLLLEQCTDYLVDDIEKLVIEFLLPKDLLYFPFDHCPVDSGMKDVKLGILYPVVARSLDRARKKMGKMRILWKKKWKLLEDGQGWAWIGERDQYETYESMYSTLINPSIVCLELTYVPPDESDDTVDAMLGAGIPAALLPRVNTDSPETISELLKSDKLPSLPSLIQEQRIAAGRSKDNRHQGHHWTLLFDDPNRYSGDGIQFSIPLARRDV